MVNLKYLQKLLFLLVMGFSISVVCACGDEDDDDEPVQPPQTSEEAQTPTSLKFYVKYEVEAENPESDLNYSRYLNGYYTDSSKEESSFSMSISPGETEYWEGVYGPFEKGDTVLFKYYSAYSSPYFRVIRARIYVQKGDDGTFAIKKEETNRNDGTLTYVIGSY